MKIELPEINYIEGVGNYVAIHHGAIKTGIIKTMVYANLRHLESILPGSKFIRVHRSFIVSVSKIKGLMELIRLKDIDTIIQFGGLYKKDFLKE